MSGESFPCFQTCPSQHFHWALPSIRKGAAFNSQRPWTLLYTRGIYREAPYTNLTPKSPCPFHKTSSGASKQWNLNWVSGCLRQGPVHCAGCRLLWAFPQTASDLHRSRHHRLRSPCREACLKPITRSFSPDSETFSKLPLLSFRASVLLSI